ncbi:MAG: hypothetical protein WC119_00420 [Synergistaceae bacterium]
MNCKYIIVLFLIAGSCYGITNRFDKLVTLEGAEYLKAKITESHIQTNRYGHVYGSMTIIYNGGVGDILVNSLPDDVRVSIGLPSREQVRASIEKCKENRRKDRESIRESNRKRAQEHQNQLEGYDLEYERQLEEYNQKYAIWDYEIRQIVSQIEIRNRYNDNLRQEANKRIELENAEAIRNGRIKLSNKIRTLGLYPLSKINYRDLQSDCYNDEEFASKKDRRFELNYLGKVIEWVGVIEDSGIFSNTGEPYLKIKTSGDYLGDDSSTIIVELEGTSEIDKISGKAGEIIMFRGIMQSRTTTPALINIPKILGITLENDNNTLQLGNCIIIARLSPMNYGAMEETIDIDSIQTKSVKPIMPVKLPPAASPRVIDLPVEITDRMAFEEPTISMPYLPNQPVVASLRGTIRCPACRGTGQGVQSSQQRIVCDKCVNGNRNCTYCKGTGWRYDTPATPPCSRCNGSGKIRQ